MTEDDDPNTPGDQGLSIGVIRAWEYVKYMGYPPSVPYTPITLALIDSGFDLDETTGAPLNGNLDYSGVPLQLDAIDGGWTAGGHGIGFPNCNDDTCWHGQMSFGVSAALSRNYFGTAGSSGGWEVKPLLIKVNADLNSWATAVYDALYNGADVINMSLVQECGYVCRNHQGGNDLKAAVKTALNNNSIVVASAATRVGHRNNKYPCSLNARSAWALLARWLGRITPTTVASLICRRPGIRSTVTRQRDG
jgi:hypothetical protein